MMDRMDGDVAGGFTSDRLFVPFGMTPWSVSIASVTVTRHGLRQLLRYEPPEALCCDRRHQESVLRVQRNCTKQSSTHGAHSHLESVPRIRR